MDQSRARSNDGVTQIIADLHVLDLPAAKGF
jgi:hypothetical protein